MAALSLALLAVLLFGVAGPATAGPPGPRPCQMLWEPSLFEGLVPPPALALPPARPSNLMVVGPRIVLPVVVHYMKSTRHPGNDVSQTFPPGVLKSFLTPSGTINDTWRAAGVRLVLALIEECQYDPGDFGLAAGSPETITSPALAGTTANIDRFLTVVRRYNYHPTLGLDLYLWWDLTDGPSQRVWGYARPYILSNLTKSTGAVWIDRQCLTETDVAPTCPGIFAHEIGHFLGLCHTCGSPSPCTRCVGASPPACPTATDGRLMYPFLPHGATLSACERQASADQARRRGIQLGP